MALCPFFLYEAHIGVCVGVGAGETQKERKKKEKGRGHNSDVNIIKEPVAVYRLQRYPAELGNEIRLTRKPTRKTPEWFPEESVLFNTKYRSLKYHWGYDVESIWGPPRTTLTLSPLFMAGIPYSSFCKPLARGGLLSPSKLQTDRLGCNSTPNIVERREDQKLLHLGVYHDVPKIS